MEKVRSKGHIGTLAPERPLTSGCTHRRPHHLIPCRIAHLRPPRLEDVAKAHDALQDLGRW